MVTNLNKTRFFGKYTFFFGLCSFVIGAVIFILTLSGVIHKQPEDPELSEGISYAFAIIFFTIYIMMQAFASLYCVVLGIIVTKLVEKNKRPRAFLIFSVVAESIFAVACGINVFLMFEFKFIVGGVFCVLCTLGAIACAILCAIAAKEGRR